MDEFPVSKLDQLVFRIIVRFMAAIFYAAGAMLLYIAPAVVIMKMGVDPQWAHLQAPRDGFSSGFFVVLGLACSALIGFVARLLQSGLQAVMWCMIGLLLLERVARPCRVETWV